MLRLLLFGVTYLLLIFCSNSQDLYIPHVACPNYFQYYFNNPHYFGKISIPTVSHSIELIVHLSQRQPLEANYYGRIVLESRDPIIYRVEFPSAKEVPKVTKISVNDEIICAQNAYGPPSSHIFLTHKLSTQPLSSNFPRIHATNISPTQQFFITTVQSSPPTKKVPHFFQTSSRNIFGSNTDTVSVLPTLNKPIRTDGQCGIGNAVAPLIFGGNEIIRGEFPWLTAIYVKSAGLRYLCAGSLVSSRTVVSAGHCFQIGGIMASRLVVHLGRYNLEDFSEQEFITREIQNLIVHPEYKSNLFPDADLAILQLKQSVKFSNHIQPICLWTDNSDSSFIVGAAGIVAGWGADEQGQAFTAVPKKVDARIVSDSECLRSSAAYNMLTSPRTFCAGNRDDTGPCMGDSGSGLMISRNGRWYLRGIVSAGQTKDRQCNLREFVVYCDVAKHIKWLQNNLVN